MTDIKNLLSKSKIGSSNLREHSIDVSNIAVEIAKKTVKGSILNESNFFIENIRVTGLLHDIGKCSKQFQEYIKKKKISKKVILHNEVGWAFLSKFLNYKKYNLNLVLDAVYWHHGINDKMNDKTVSDILYTLSENEISLMKNFVTDLLGDDYLVENGNVDTDFIKTPTYFSNDPNLNKKQLLFTSANILDGGFVYISGVKSEYDINLNEYVLVGDVPVNKISYENKNYTL